MLRALPQYARSAPAQVAIPAGRDLRLDLFRGIALWLIFLDHIPSNIVSWITIRNYGFSDATEIFVFISGYTAAFVYGRAMHERGVVVASARILKRAWQVYVAHIFLFAVYMAEISYISTSFDNPLYGEEAGIFDFLHQPDVALVQALLLKFKPANMDILPLYITLLAAFPPFVWLLLRWPNAALAASLGVYILRWQFDWNLPAYPSGEWAFNPFAWQLLFGFGAWCGLGGANRISAVMRSRVVLWLSVAYLLFSFAIVMTWYFPRYGHYVPQWLADWIYPIDKTNSASCSLPRAGRVNRSLPAARLARSKESPIPSRHFVGSAFIGNLLFRGILGLRCALPDGGGIRRSVDAGRGQRRWYLGNDRDCGPHIVVQEN
jgi:hypothetical protein